MQQEELIRRLAQAICRELQEGGEKTALVFARKDQQLPQRVEKQLGREWRIVYYQDSDLPAEVHRYVLPCLYLDQMVDLALGKAGSRLMHGVRQVLLTGKNVEVCQWEYRQYIETAPLAMVGLYEGYYRVLQDFGLIDWQEQKTGSCRHRHLLLSEADVLAAGKGKVQELELAAGCRITPLARDVARELGIRLKHERGVGR